MADLGTALIFDIEELLTVETGAYYTPSPMALGSASVFDVEELLVLATGDYAIAGTSPCPELPTWMTGQLWPRGQGA